MQTNKYNEHLQKKAITLIQSSSYAKSTKKNYLLFLEKIFNYLNEHNLKFNNENCAKYQQYLKDQDYSKPTIHLQSNVCNLIIKKLLNKPNGVKTFAYKANNIKSKYITDKQLNALKNELEPTYFFILNLIYHYGFKLQEVLTIRIKDLHPKNKITVRSPSGKHERTIQLESDHYKKLKNHAKNSKSLYEEDKKVDGHWVWLSQLEKNPGSYKLDDRFVFIANSVSYSSEHSKLTRKHLDKSTITRALTNALSEKKFDTVHLRHSYAINRILKGDSPAQISKDMGYSSVQNFVRQYEQIYLDL